VTSTRGGPALILVVVLVGGALGFQALRPHDAGLGGGSSCDLALKAHQRVASIKTGRPIATSSDYLDSAHAIRRAAVTASADVAPTLHAIADAYGFLSTYFTGFDPSDGSTYGVVELHAAEIERQQGLVDQADANLASWLDRSCR